MNEATYTGLATGAGVGSDSGRLATTGGSRSSASRESLRRNAPARSVTATMLAAMVENVAAEKTR
jgi:hypothetical protein